MKKQLAVLLLVIFALQSVPALDFTVFNSANSDLPYNKLYCITFDQNGNIWFGGQEDAGSGLAMVSMLSADLSTWTVYDPLTQLGLSNAADDRAYYIAVDDQNNKWFCTHYGASVLRANGTAEELTFSTDAYTRTIQTDDEGNVYLSDRDAVGIWFTSDYGTNWSLWTADSIGQTVGRPEIYDLEKDSQGRLWLCTWYGVAYRDLSGSWNWITELIDGYTYCMTIDADDNVWVADESNLGVWKIASDETVTKIDSTTYSQLNVSVTDMAVDADNDVWFATAGNGILEIKAGDGSLVQYTAANSDLPQDDLTDLEIKGGAIWAATTDSGVVMIEGILGTDDKVVDQPTSFALHANYPNPFNPSTSISFDLMNSTDITLTVYDLLGNRIATLAQGNYPAGTSQVEWNGLSSDGQSLPSGIYFYRLQAGAESQSRKMMLLK